MNTIVGLFDDYGTADRAVQALRDYGVDGNRISVVTRHNDASNQVTAVEAGAATGAAAGGLVGLLAGLSALLVPGIGPVIATGTIATTLATTLVGAGLGAATGGLLGVLVDLGFSKEEAEFYAEGVKRGGVLVSVGTDSQDEEQIREILRGAGAVDMDTRRQTWLENGWTTFKETEEHEENVRH